MGADPADTSGIDTDPTDTAHTDPLEPEAHQLRSWDANATAWTDALRSGAIRSRAVTNPAILDLVTSLAPRTALDLGCGEGWLVRALTERGIDALGVDAVPGLIANARSAGIGRYLVSPYDDVSNGSLGPSRFDVVVANFSLVGEASTERVVRAVPGLLTPGGRLVLQTVHPAVACGEGGYQSGWRPGSWAGFGREFVDPAPWFFRTVSDWVRLLLSANLRLVDLREPTDVGALQPSSLILVGD